MFFNRSKRLMALAALMATVLPFAVQPAAALQCKNASQAVNGDKKWTNLGARTHARWKWHRHVKSKCGLIWSTWLRAKSKSYSCHRVRAKWRCKATARPCRPF